MALMCVGAGRNLTFITYSSATCLKQNLKKNIYHNRDGNYGLYTPHLHPPPPMHTTNYISALNNDNVIVFIA